MEISFDFGFKENNIAKLAGFLEAKSKLVEDDRQKEHCSHVFVYEYGFLLGSSVTFYYGLKLSDLEELNKSIGDYVAYGRLEVVSYYDLFDVNKFHKSDYFKIKSEQFITKSSSIRNSKKEIEALYEVKSLTKKGKKREDDDIKLILDYRTKIEDKAFLKSIDQLGMSEEKFDSKIKTLEDFIDEEREELRNVNKEFFDIFFKFQKFNLSNKKDNPNYKTIDEVRYETLRKWKEFAFLMKAYFKCYMRDNNSGDVFKSGEYNAYKTEEFIII